MQQKYNRDSGRTATALLATAYVLLTGLGVCLLIVLVAADRQTSWKLAAICVAGAFCLWFLFWALRDRRSNQSSLTNIVWLGRKAESSSELNYEPRRRRRRRSQEIPSANEPPTVERLRELSDNVKTWVPSRNRAEKHRRGCEEP